MKLATALFAFLVLASSQAVFAAAPSQMDLIKSLDDYYANNSLYENCFQQLAAGKPISVPVAYLDRLSAASFAEGLSAVCSPNADTAVDSIVGTINPAIFLASDRCHKVCNAPIHNHQGRKFGCWMECH